MGLRERLMSRVGGSVRRAGKRLVERIIGEGAPPGTQPSDAGPAHAARTSAWPPAVLGEHGLAAEPPPHPADLAEAGEIVSRDADFAVGTWEIDEDVQTAPSGSDGRADPPAQEPVAARAPEHEPPPPKTLAGSVAQQEWLPMPPPRPQPVEVDAPPAIPDHDVPVDASPPAQATPDTISQAKAPVDVVELTPEQRQALEAQLVDTLKTVYDPEIPVDIYELGLIYGVTVQADGTAEIQMTLTSPNCPAAQSMPSEVEVKTGAVEGIRQSNVEIVWEPPWGPEKMSEAARLELNIDF